MINNLEAFRTANGLTQTELGKYLKVGKGSVSQIETGARPLPDKHILTLRNNTRGWDVTPGNFMTKAEQRESGIFQLNIKAGRDIRDSAISNGSGLAAEYAALKRENEELKEQLKEAKAIAQKYLGIIESLSSHK